MFYIHDFFFSGLYYVITGNSMVKPKKDVGIGTCELLCNLSYLHTAIQSPTFRGFWHCHSYSLLHFVFNPCLYAAFLHNSTLLEDVVL